jgi:uncharacterized protein
VTIYRAHPHHVPWHLCGEARASQTAGQAAQHIIRHRTRHRTPQGTLAGAPRSAPHRSRKRSHTLVLATMVAGLVGGTPGLGVAQGSPQAVPQGTAEGSIHGSQMPQPVGLVNDFAHVIPAGEADRITQIANDVRTKSRGEIAVVTLSDIGDRDPSDVGVALIRQWKIGKAGNPGDPTRNAGAVILVVPKETNSDGRGRCWITTGSGAEGFITDADAGDMCRDAIPDFRNHDYGAGIALLTYETAQRFAKEYNFTVDTTLAVAVPPAAAQHQGGLPPMAVFFLFLAFYLLLSIMARRGGGRGGCLPVFLPFGGGWSGGGGGWSGGGGGGGFGGFGGGGGTSGGGGGGSW